MPPSGVDYASEFLNGYAPEYVYYIDETFVESLELLLDVNKIYLVVL